MAAYALQREERIGLLVAVIAHAALIGFLVLRPESGEVVHPPARIAVTLSDEVGLDSTSPTPSADAAPDVAPMLGDAAIPEQAIADAPPIPLPPVATPPEPRPAPVETRRPAPAASETRKPDRPSPPKQESRPSPSPPKAAPKSRADAKPGGSRLGRDFLQGVSNTSEGTSTSTATTFGPREQASLARAITRQLRPHWSAPQGADADLLVTTVRFNLAKDGSLIGEPRVIRQTGITDANAAQVSRHAEQAIRAVKLAAPFNLPVEFYDQWKTVTSNFDRNLSQ